MGKPLRVRRLSGEVRRLIEQSYGGSIPHPSSIDEVMGRLGAIKWEYDRLSPEAVKRTLVSDEERRSKKELKRRRVDIRKSSSVLEDSGLEVDLTKSMMRERLKSRSKEKMKNVELELDRQTTTKTKVDHHHDHNLSSSSSNVRLKDIGGIDGVLKSTSKKMKPTENVELELDRQTTKTKVDHHHDHNLSSSSNVRLKDIGGIDGVLKMLKTQVIHPLRDPELLATVGVSPIAGILFHGPPGCGKTRLARAIANEAGVPFYKVSSTDFVSGVSGASEESIRELFSKAYATAPSIVFIDEIDAIASKRENLQREMEKRIVTQLMTCMEDTRDDVEKRGHVLVIAATNRPDALDPALRRPGRFDREILLDVPDESARVEILSIVARHAKLDADFDPVKISRATPGFVGADLAAVVNTAGHLAITRAISARESLDDEYKKLTPEEKAGLAITSADVEEATKLVQPSSKREGFASIPNVKWEDVGGLDLLRTEFHRHIVNSIKYANEYEASGISSHTGFLLYGPPGCGKTLIAKAVANEAGANFIHIEGPALMNKYVGETEKAVRTIFSHARTCSPCIIFFDEVDALATKRGNEGAWVVERPLTQLMIELDGGNQRKGVYVIGATNRPEVIDRALLRPGRLGKHLYVSLPNQEERGLILEAVSRNKHLDADVDLIAIARSEACANFSGADLADLMNEAALGALHEYISRTEAAAAHEGKSVSPSQSFVPARIKAVHIERAFRKIKPSVSDEEIKNYDLVAKWFSAS